MNTILVEARKDVNVQATLDALARECGNLGYRVVRWRGPLSGRVPYRRRIARCEVAVVFNGSHPRYERPLRRLRGMGAEVLFVELGWYPQTGTFQIDHRGINAAASWVNAPLASPGRKPLRVSPEGDLLLILQVDDDTQVTRHSPWFANMHAVVEHVARHSNLPVRVRAHPRHPPAEAVVELVERTALRWDDSRTLAEALQGCTAAACVNSSGAVEALHRRLPVLCYGNAVYRQPGVVYCMRDDPQHTRAVTEALRRGECRLFEERIEEMMARIERHQWTIAQIPRRLPPLLDAALRRRAVPRPEWWRLRGRRTPSRHTLRHQPIAGRGRTGLRKAE